jgi:hypothetical protein
MSLSSTPAASQNNIISHLPLPSPKIIPPTSQEEEVSLVKWQEQERPLLVPVSVAKSDQTDLNLIKSVDGRCDTASSFFFVF